MSASSSAEQHALRGLLLVVVEVQNIIHANEADFPTLTKIMKLVESHETAELVQLARAALETRPEASRKTFFGIVTEQDTYFSRPVDPENPPRGPIMMETYLNELHADRAQVEAMAPRFMHYGWVRVAEIHVEIPETPSAIPAAAASTHI